MLICPFLELAIALGSPEVSRPLDVDLETKFRVWHLRQERRLGTVGSHSLWPRRLLGASTP